MTPDTPTRELLRQAGGGDGSFGRLYERIAPAVFAWASLQVPPPLRQRLDPEDVVQEVWCRALATFERYDPERAAFRTWIFAIARNVLLEGFRRLKRAPRGGAGDATSSVLDLDEVPLEATSLSRRVARDEALRSFLDHVAELDPKDRELLLHRGLEGLQHQRAAELVGLSPDAAAKRWQRLRDRLRDVVPDQDLLSP